MASGPKTIETIRYTADTVVLATHDDTLHVLLVRRAADHDTEPGKWALPGGHVDTDETGRAAAVRELFEETGLPLTAAEKRRLSLVGVYHTGPGPARAVRVCRLHGRPAAPGGRGGR